MKSSGTGVLSRSIEVVLRLLLGASECKVVRCSQQLALVETVDPDHETVVSIKPPVRLTNLIRSLEKSVDQAFPEDVRRRNADQLCADLGHGFADNFADLVLAFADLNIQTKDSLRQEHQHWATKIRALRLLCDCCNSNEKCSRCAAILKFSDWTLCYLYDPDYLADVKIGRTLVDEMRTDLKRFSGRSRC